MSRIINTTVYTALIVSVMALSACASKSEPPPVAAPAPVETVAEKPVAQEAAPAPTAVAAEQQASTQTTQETVVKKAKKKKAKKAPAKIEPPAPAPVTAPAPVVEQQAPVAVAPPAPPVVVTPPAKEEAGFLEQYWMWLLGLIIAIAGIVFWRMKSRQ